MAGAIARRDSERLHEEPKTPATNKKKHTHTNFKLFGAIFFSWIQSMKIWCLFSCVFFLCLIHQTIFISGVCVISLFNFSSFFPVLFVYTLTAAQCAHHILFRSCLPFFVFKEKKNIYRKKKNLLIFSSQSLQIKLHESSINYFTYDLNKSIARFARRFSRCFRSCCPTFALYFTEYFQFAYSRYLFVCTYSVIVVFCMQNFYTSISIV